MDRVSFGTTALRAPFSPTDSRLDHQVPLAEVRVSAAQGVKTRYWSAPFPDAADVVAWAAQNRIPVDPAVDRYATGVWERDLEAAARFNAVRPSTDERATVTGLTSTLLEQQQVAVLATSKAWLMHPDGTKQHRGMLIADEPGLGKTIIALSALRAAPNESARAVVVCPTSLTKNWVAEMRQHFTSDTFTPWVAHGITPTDVPEGTDVVVIGWEILHAWVDTLKAWKPDAIVGDEGHYVKSGAQQTRSREVVARNTDGSLERDASGNVKMTKEKRVISGSARASAILKIGSDVARRHGLVVALTGTPIVNRPVELLALLEFVGVHHLLGGGNAYRMRYCGPKKKSIGNGRETYDFSGSSHLLELNTRLAASGHYLRRTKQTLVDAGVLPPKYVDGAYCYDYTARPRPWRVDVAPADMARYREAEGEVVDFFSARAQEIAHTLRVDVRSDRVRKKMVGEGKSQLQRIAELRLLAAQIKVPLIIAKIESLIARGEKVVVAAHHREIVDQYAEAFTGLKIQGGMGVDKIEAAKALFNETPVNEHPVLVLSVEAGKTGHTLCKQALHGAGQSCALMVFAEQVWTPGDEAQAQDRIWRIGQDRTVHISNALLPGTIDEDIYAQRGRKRTVVNAAIDAVDPDATGTGEKGIGALALTFVRQFQTGGAAQRTTSRPGARVGGP